ncbi:ABC transporter permease [Protofrankia symbiont of Coriaria ruscifolia]|uniref:ABC transporter permease n=1 Tax=Protofrankia symbiont of Coriaria ruscifolia TaxID=1306542 RepID=UPI0010416123|nr:ABC transporter permease [Protofrankia symbiont of Coriaria ruscifolia]
MSVIKTAPTVAAVRTRRPYPPGLVLSAAMLALILIAALAPGLFIGRDPLAADPVHRLQPPSGAHLFGTDELGRDLYARVLHGAALSLSAAAIALVVGMLCGTALGLIAGTAGGRTDDLLMRATDVLLAIPSLLVSLAVVTALGFGTAKTAVAVGVTGIAGFARITRAEVLRVSVAPYTEAAHVIGVRRPAVLLRHVLPNAWGPVLGFAAVQFGASLLAVSTLGFLGYGAPPPTPEWGSLVASGRSYFAQAWWLSILPGLVIAATVLAANRIARAVQGEDGRLPR